MLGDGLPESCRLDAARHRKPIEQGRIDKLCGLYAAINGLRLAVPLPPHRDRMIFETGVKYLDERGWLSTVLTQGMSNRLFASLVRYHATRHSLHVERIPAAPPSMTQESAISAELAVMAAITKGKPVLISIDKPLDHYSVICGYSPTRWHLFDSYGYRWLSRQHCTFGRQLHARHRLLAWVISSASSTPSYR